MILHERNIYLNETSLNYSYVIIAARIAIVFFSRAIICIIHNQIAYLFFPPKKRPCSTLTTHISFVQYRTEKAAVPSAHISHLEKYDNLTFNTKISSAQY